MKYYQAQYYNDALLHFGVKGMKWGVRRKRAVAAVKKSIRDSRINRVNKKITKLQKKKDKQVLQIARKLYKNGHVTLTRHNDAVRTARKINSNKTKLASIKRGDSRKVTRLKVKRQPLKDYVSAAESRIYLNPPQSDIKKYKKAKESLRRIDKKIKNQYKKQKKKRQ